MPTKETLPKQIIGIMGYGQVGQALEEVYLESLFGQVLIKDLDRDEFHNNMEVLNICIPYSKDFNKIVMREIRRTKARLTIIHSTVPPYTTKEIRGRINKNKKDKVAVIHSPVICIGMESLGSIQKFRKYMGIENKRDGRMALDHLRLLGFKQTGVKQPAVITEVSELIGSAYHGICMEFARYAEHTLRKYKIDFNEFEKYNESFNKGCRRSKQRKFAKPSMLLMDGVVDDMIINNSKILQKCENHKLIKIILENKRG